MLPKTRSGKFYLVFAVLFFTCLLLLIGVAVWNGFNEQDAHPFIAVFLCLLLYWSGFEICRFERKKEKSEERLKNGRCVECGYNLRHLPDSGPCPQCGQVRTVLH